MQQAKAEPLDQDCVVLTLTISGIPFNLPDDWIYTNFLECGNIFVQYFNKLWFNDICDFSLSLINTLTQDNLKIKLFYNNSNSECAHGLWKRSSIVLENMKLSS